MSQSINHQSSIINHSIIPRTYSSVGGRVAPTIGGGIGGATEVGEGRVDGVAGVVVAPVDDAVGGVGLYAYPQLDI